MKTVTATDMLRASEKAAKYFGNGFHCAEAVAASALEALGETSPDAAAHATAFGGGFGRTYQEACGALSGALIVIGHLYGRREPGGEWDIPAKLGAEMRRRFLNAFGTAHCATLRRQFGDDRQMAECRILTQSVAKTLLELLDEDPARYTASCCDGRTDAPKENQR